MSKSLVPVWDLPESTSSAGFFLGGIYLFVQKKFSSRKVVKCRCLVGSKFDPVKNKVFETGRETGDEKTGRGEI